jgi:hypothetical protein
VEDLFASAALPVKSAIFQAILNLMLPYACFLGAFNDLRLIATRVGRDNLDDGLHGIAGSWLIRHLASDDAFLGTNSNPR